MPTLIINGQEVNDITLNGTDVKQISDGNILWQNENYRVATPVVSCTSNVVTMTCATTGATIRYSTNGGSSWSTYSSAITISATTTYFVYATKSGMFDSEQVSYTATYMQRVASPSISCTNNVVTMTCSTSGATIKYSTNGGSSWSDYSSAITISATTNYLAYATKSGMLDSTQVSYTATYVQPKLPAPTISFSVSSNTVKVSVSTPNISGVEYTFKATSGTTRYACGSSSAGGSWQTKTGSGSNSTYTYWYSGTYSTVYFYYFYIRGEKTGYTTSEYSCHTGKVT